MTKPSKIREPHPDYWTSDELAAGSIARGDDGTIYELHQDSLAEFVRKTVGARAHRGSLDY